MTRLNKTNIPQNKFVECVTRHALDGGTRQDVADELNIGVSSVYQRIWQYKKLDNPIKFPMFRRDTTGGNRVNSISANELIAAMIASRAKTTA